jgi:hypothetical protein
MLKRTVSDQPAIQGPSVVFVAQKRYFLPVGRKFILKKGFYLGLDIILLSESTKVQDFSAV